MARPLGVHAHRRREHVLIDPFGDIAAVNDRMRWEYPPIVAGEPELVRSTAGRHRAELGEVLGIA